MFGKENEVSERILKEIKGVSTRLAEVEGQLEASKGLLSLTSEHIDLQKSLTELQVEYDREKEKHDREKREVEHMVGLERKRQEFEVEAAKRDVKLTVREENLKEDRGRFEKEMEYTRKRFEEEVSRIEDLTKQILKRLPTVSIEKAIDLRMNGNESKVEAEA